MPENLVKPLEAANGATSEMRNEYVQTSIFGDKHTVVPADSSTYTLSSSQTVTSYNQTIYSFSFYNTSTTTFKETMASTFTTSQPEQIDSNAESLSSINIQFNISSPSPSMIEMMKDSEIRYNLMTPDQKLIATQVCKCQSVMFSNITLGTYNIVYTISGYGTFNTGVNVSMNGSEMAHSDITSIGLRQDE
jgi:hypothetical protein